MHAEGTVRIHARMEAVGVLIWRSSSAPEVCSASWLW